MTKYKLIIESTKKVFFTDIYDTMEAAEADRDTYGRQARFENEDLDHPISTSITAVNVIDCTPTWSNLLALMLTVYAENYKKGKERNNTDLEQEFKNMARAADMWNEHVKETETAKA